VLAAVHLDQLAKTAAPLTTQSMLAPTPTRLPQSRPFQQSSQRVAAQFMPIARQLLARQRWTKIAVLLAVQRQHFRPRRV
jgi:hypothetical protein